ncbi:hypothetical protein PGH07_05760 [Sulfurovum sp. zt1-1]|uniref:DUF11 domain-containing protein n=1 Tax=Sulfurovum zhangzhouensis TaxID=3019067 RepID=A0ABT7QXW5_9BACT|nr:hypothetical protein [Sulfurovum zhangzhouensis]MDM5271673.1 hypothetical protein [Sulfurovum zhangzhouensis]
MKVKKIFYSMAALAAVCGMTPLQAWYLPSPGDTHFELDGNIANGAAPGDDWSDIKDGNSSAFSTTDGIVYDPQGTSIFTQGGSKDVRPVSAWRHTSGSVPDKNEILNMAAAAYNIDIGDGPELIVYLHGDRYSNDGDAQMGVWFFQEHVSMNNDGTFSGEHRLGDILMLAEFVNGGANAHVKIYEWDPSEPKNLRLKAEGVGGAAPNYYYATSNASPTPAWTTYTPKSLVDGYPEHTYPENSFFEGGINLSWVFQGEQMPCFSSFLMETRSSHKYDAQLKDFALGDLNTCKLEVSKECLSSTLSRVDYDTLDHNYTYTVENKGFGALTDVKLIDDQGTPADDTDDISWFIGQPLSSGGTYEGNYTVTDSYLNPPENTIYAIGYIGTYEMAPVHASDTCAPVQLSPTIDVTKDCNQTLESVGSVTAVKLNYSGQVCNISDANDANASKLVNVEVTDDQSGLTHYIEEDLYPLNDPQGRPNCAPYTGSYYPSAPAVASGNPCANSYSDTVTATGEYKVAKDSNETNSTSDTGSATCGLCVDCN